MRVIAGKCKSLPLKSVPGINTRPTTDRIKETLFNIISPRIERCRFLDLYSGSGAIGIEALSRGASHSCFIEKDAEALAVIKTNLIFTKLEELSTVIKGDVLKVLSLNCSGEPFDVVFMDPPYNKGLEIKTLKELKGSNWVHHDTLYICEVSCGTDIEKSLPEGFEILRYKKYKTNAHVFLRKVE